MKQEMTSPDRRPQISLAQVAGSALAAVSAAVVASFLGVGGTVLGAAIGSMVATVGGAVYAHSFRRAGERLGETKVVTVVTRSRVGVAHGGPGPGDVPSIERAVGQGLDSPRPPYAESGSAIPGDGAGPETVIDAPQRPRWMRWQTGVVLAVTAFVIAMLVISVIELTIGRPISGGSGGTTVGHLTRPSTAQPAHQETPAPAPTATTPAVTPTSAPTTTAPTPDPATSAPATSAPSGTPTPTGTPATTAPAVPVGTPTG